MTKRVIELTDDNFGEIALDVNTETTVEFYSGVSSNKSNMRISIDENKLFAQEFSITKTPTIIHFKNGVEISRDIPS